jgi:hypothetical protein
MAMAELIGAKQPQISKWETGALEISFLRKVYLWDWLKKHTAS